MANKYTDAVFKCDVRGTDKLVLFILAGFADNEKGECWPSYKTIARQSGLGYSTVQDSFKRLKDAGFLWVVGRHLIGNTDQYTLIFRLNLEKLQEHVLVSTASRNHYQSEPGMVYREKGQHVPEAGSPVPGDENHVPGSTDELISNSSENSLEDSSENAIAIANTNLAEDQQQKTAGETPATPQSPVQQSAVSCSDDTEPEVPEPEVPVWASLPASGPTPPHDSGALPSLEDEPARWLANYLWCFLSIREDVEIPHSWEKFWTKDFQDALDTGWSVDDLNVAIRKSQCGKAWDYYKRGASIVANLELLVEEGRQLEEKELLGETECPVCHGLLIGNYIDLLDEHIFDCYDRNTPIDPEDAAEEEAMWLADELVSEGLVREHPDMEMYYPWADDDDDREIFDPWADMPEQLAQPTIGDQLPY
jgi:Helix-turn-helix domain